MFKKVIVGVDFSDLSIRAARVAIGLARPLNAEVVLVHVIAPGADYTDAARFVTEVRPGLEVQLEKFKTEMSTAFPGAKIEWGIVDGRAADEMVKFAERWNGDLIVTGTSGRSGVARMLLGSVAERIVRTAKVPVLVVGHEQA